MRVLNGPFAARALIAALVVAVAIGLQFTVPALPRFLALLPAVLIASFLGGRWFGCAALLVTSTFAILDPHRDGAPGIDAPFLIALLCFLASGGLATALMDLHRNAVARLGRERHRLEAALRAADAAVWEISPRGKLYWDENFFRLVGLQSDKTPPKADAFLAMIDPRDRPRMTEARRMMDAGIEPPPADEYRLIRPDGKVVWLENHRTRVSNGGDFFIGITQDITRRKLAEERVQALLSEAEHRAKNQFAVIMAVARETSRAVENSAAFETAFAARLQALSRSHDLMAKGNWGSTPMRALVVAHLESFGSEQRYELTGPEIKLTSAAAQYLGMAFHELATNAAKYGALAAPYGRIHVAWEVTEGMNGPELKLIWKESGAATRGDSFASTGFGTKMVMQIVPAALGGQATRDITSNGISWKIVAPLANIVDAVKRSSAHDCSLQPPFAGNSSS